MKGQAMSSTAKRKPKATTPAKTEPARTAPNPAVIHAIADQYLELAVKIKDPERRPDYSRVVIALDRHAGQLLEEAMNAGALTSYPEMAESRRITIEVKPDCHPNFWNNAMHEWSVKIPACVRGGPGMDSIGSVEFAAKCRAVAGVLHAEAKAMDGGDEQQAFSLRRSEQLVLLALADFDISVLASVPEIALKTRALFKAERLPSCLSDTTIKPALRRLIELQLAERPDGTKQGVRLTSAGRKLARKIDRQSPVV
ncbi:MAG: hypothetical protein K8S99_11460 [Planctomycetes bacterium]|nr:hypothetical protein [Planctomycetota bacterium]